MEGSKKSIFYCTSDEFLRTCSFPLLLLNQLKHKTMGKQVAKFDGNESQYTEYYSEGGFWDKVSSVALKAGRKVIYHALALYYVMMDGNVYYKEKMLIVGALGYLILPVDLIPDFIPVAGFTDDLGAIMTVYNMVKNNITPEIEEKVEQKMDELFG